MWSKRCIKKLRKVMLIRESCFVCWGLLPPSAFRRREVVPLPGTASSACGQTRGGSPRLRPRAGCGPGSAGSQCTGPTGNRPMASFLITSLPKPTARQQRQNQHLSSPTRQLKKRPQNVSCTVTIRVPLGDKNSLTCPTTPVPCHIRGCGCYFT